ncbi:MAG: hypothetical protein KHW77_07585 [Adlercreutzia equolifaciens]|nr:hypothetical protein [Adlercreutzia equolifaciens]
MGTTRHFSEPQKYKFLFVAAQLRGGEGLGRKARRLSVFVVNDVLRQISRHRHGGSFVSLRAPLSTRLPSLAFAGDGLSMGLGRFVFFENLLSMGLGRPVFFENLLSMGLGRLVFFENLLSMGLGRLVFFENLLSMGLEGSYSLKTCFPWGWKARIL